MQFQRDDEGSPTVIDDGKQPMLANFLQSNIQDDLSLGQDILEVTKRVIAGELKDYDFSGNAHILNISASGVSIKRADDEQVEKQRYLLNEFQTAISDWLTFISKTPDLR